MNCLECRRRLLATPQARDAQLATHLHDCPACARLVQQQNQFEKQLGAALCVPVPDNLHDRVRLAASMSRRRPIGWLAMAAMVGTLTVSLGLGGWEYSNRAQLTQQFAQSMQATSAAQPGLTTPQLAGLRARLDGYLQSADMGHIVSSRQRSVDGQPRAEFEIAHGDERVYVFMVPDNWLAMSHDVQAHGMPGKLIPFEGGVIGVFCPDRDMLRRFATDAPRSMRRRS